MDVVDAGTCGDHEHISPTPPQVLNVKCLTGRLSEQQLQRATAPPEPGRREVLIVEAPVLSLDFFTFSFHTAIAGMLLYEESNHVLMTLMTQFIQCL